MLAGAVTHAAPGSGQAPDGLPPMVGPAPPADGVAWVSSPAGAEAAGLPMGWGYAGHPGQQAEHFQQQGLVHPAPLPAGMWVPAGAFSSQTIPADWGSGSRCFDGVWAPPPPPPPQLEACPAGSAPSCGGQMLPPFMDPRLFGVPPGPMFSPWPAPMSDPEAYHAYMMAAAGGAAQPLLLPPDQQQYLQAQPQLCYPAVSMAAYQQPYACSPALDMPPPLAPAFAISPPAPAVQGPAQSRLGLLRKKKSALPVEPSFGCDSGCLESGGSAVLLHSPEMSQVVDDGWGLGGEHHQQYQQQQQATPDTPGWGRGRHSLDLAEEVQAEAEGQAAEEEAEGEDQAAAAPSIEFDKAPRPVEWRPYSFADYRQRNYDSKQASKYWALGGLGPARHPGDAEFQAQQDKRERQQQFGRQVNKTNRERLAAQPQRQKDPPPRPGADVRERALQFAKTVPKPTSFKSRQSVGDTPSRTSSGIAAAAAAAVAEADAAAAAGEQKEADAAAAEGAEAAAVATTEPAAAAGAEAAATVAVEEAGVPGHAAEDETVLADTQVQLGLLTLQDTTGLAQGAADAQQPLPTQDEAAGQEWEQGQCASASQQEAQA